MQSFQELNDEQLETVVGGRHHHSHGPTTGTTSTGVGAQGSANGGILHIDKVYARTLGVSVGSNGESVSTAIGFALAIAI
ncbi:MAG: hypothetical protein NVS2B12_17650 [Ktedonobacteraceae bacterium]